jgi:hypothetical protein
VAPATPEGSHDEVSDSHNPDHDVSWLVALTLFGIAVALLRGGSFAGWARVRVYWSAVALASLAVQLILHNPPIDRQPWALSWGPLIWTSCLAALLTVLVRNAIGSSVVRGPWAVAAMGVGLNLLVVVANGGFMPQSAEARMTTRGAPEAITQFNEPQLRNVVPMSPETRLNLLGDVIPEPAWLPRTNVISIGDLLLASGLAWWAFLITAASPRRAVRVGVA